jgi:hypothetical protein
MQVPWRERPPDLATWPVRPAATEVVAHATLSVPQPERADVGRVCLVAAEMPVNPRRQQRPSRVDCAARNSHAQGTSRCSRFAPPALRAADGLDRASREPFLATIDGRAEVLDGDRRQRYCRINSPATHGTLHIARCGARSNRRSQATVRSRLRVLSPGRLFARRHVREADGRTGLRFGLRPGAAPPVHPESKSPRCRGNTPASVDASGAAPSALDPQQEAQPHRRSEWAGVSWPKDDDQERGAVGGTGLALARGTTAAAATAPTDPFARSYAPLRGRPRASASSWN